MSAEEASPPWLVSADQVYNMLQFPSSLLLLDARPAEAFQLAHLRTAVNVPQAPGAIEGLDECHRRLKGRGHCKVVVYGDENEDPQDGSTEPARLFALLREEARCQELFYLEGGFRQFYRGHHYMCVGESLEEPTSNSKRAFPSLVLGWLYVGSFDNASNDDQLTHLKITHVVNTAAECVNKFPEKRRYFNCNLDDVSSQNIGDVFEAAAAFIHEVYEARQAMGERAAEEGPRVLVHCQMGMSRAPTMTMGYLILKHGLSFEEALRHLKAARPFVNPNKGFQQQLRDLAGEPPPGAE